MSHIPTNHYCRCYSWRFSLHPALCNHLISSLAASNRASSANLLSRYSGRQVSLCFSTNAMISSWRDKAPAILGDCWGGRPRFGFHVALGSPLHARSQTNRKRNVGVPLCCLSGFQLFNCTAKSRYRHRHPCPQGRNSQVAMILRAVFPPVHERSA